MSDLPDHHEDHPDIISHNARMGLLLFVIYFALYAGFLLLNILAPQTMAKTSLPISSDRELSLGGPNLAVVTGILLIFTAFLFALIYMRLTKSKNPGGAATG